MAFTLSPFHPQPETSGKCALRRLAAELSVVPTRARWASDRITEREPSGVAAAPSAKK